MFFAERIKEWLRPRPPNEDAQQTKEEAEALSTKVEIGEDGVPGRVQRYRVLLNGLQSVKISCYTH